MAGITLLTRLKFSLAVLMSPNTALNTEIFSNKCVIERLIVKKIPEVQLEEMLSLRVLPFWKLCPELIETISNQNKYY